ncbi:hypothetical protein NUM3379_08220 [Kineococcus sp. NUM-3379]
MSTCVLVGGAWLGAWAWREVAADLRARGHDVHPLTLTGLAERAHLGGPDVDLDTHVADVVAALRHIDADGVVLVGHSYAGTVVTAAADRVPELVAALVHVDTAALPEGMSVLDYSPPQEQERLRARVGDGWRLPLPRREELGGDATGVDGEVWERLRRLATPHPFGTYTQPVRYPGGGLGSGHGPRRVGIACRDAQQVLALARAQPGNPVFADLLAPDLTWHELDAGHWPMFTAPRELAALLAEV